MLLTTILLTSALECSLEVQRLLLIRGSAFELSSANQLQSDSYHVIATTTISQLSNSGHKCFGPLYKTSNTSMTHGT